MAERERKTFTLELKADKAGEFRAVFATLGVVDKQGDVTRPGAFEDGASVNISAWGHAWSSLPIGDGTIHEEDDEAIVDGSFYLNTEQGKNAYTTLKERAVRGVVEQEWSYGFEVMQSSFGQQDGQDVRFLEKLKVFEVSPVMLGAGIDTRTLAIKGHDLTFEEHSDQLKVSVGEWMERAKAGAAERIKEGRALSAARRESLGSMAGRLREAAAELDTMLDETAPPPKDGAGRSEQKVEVGGIDLTRVKQQFDALDAFYNPSGGPNDSPDG